MGAVILAHAHPVTDTGKHFFIDAITKRITTESDGLALVQYSHNSERITFHVPKLIEGHEMAKCNSIEVHFNNVDKVRLDKKSFGIYTVEDLVEGDEDCTFTWLIDGRATNYCGSLSFAVHLSCIAEDGTVDYNFPTMTYSDITVGETVVCSDIMEDEYPGIVKDFEDRIAALESNKITAVISEVNLVAEKWEGTDNLFSQVVTIDGVTKNSQVDLTPSVEQLVTFYDKDLCFVTENDGGTVTVYAIGQKPLYDYVIQATITEVQA